MFRAIAVAVIATMLLTYPACAQLAAATTCDALAGHPEEPNHQGRGVEWGKVDAVPAIAACRLALAQAPDTPDIMYRLARTLMQVGEYDEALPMMLKAAEAGYGPAQTAYGTAYSFGQGVEIDDNIAFEWLTKAAASGHSIGRNNLALLYLHGEGTPVDIERAVQLLQQSADQGYALAMFNLAGLYERGHVVQRDWDASFRLYTAAAERGLIGAILAVARAYEFGRGVQQNDAVAYAWWVHGSEAGSIEAQTHVARHLAYGYGVTSDVPAALALYRHLARVGYPRAQAELAGLLMQSYATPLEMEEGAMWLKQAGDGGEIDSYLSLAKYFEGHHLPQLALLYAERTRLLGNPQLQERATALIARVTKRFPDLSAPAPTAPSPVPRDPAGSRSPAAQWPEIRL